MIKRKMSEFIRYVSVSFISEAAMFYLPLMELK